MTATIQHTLRQEVADQCAVYTSFVPDVSLCLARSELADARDCIQASLVILELMSASECNEGCESQETLTSRERAAYLAALKSMIQRVEDIANTVEDRSERTTADDRPTAPDLSRGGATMSLVQAPVQGPQFADLAHLLIPGRVPTIDGCVQGLCEITTKVGAFHGRVRDELHAIRELLPQSDRLPMHRALQLCQAVRSIVDKVDEEVEHTAHFMEAVCTDAGVSSKACRNQARVDAGASLDKRQGGAA